MLVISVNVALMDLFAFTSILHDCFILTGGIRRMGLLADT